MDLSISGFSAPQTDVKRSSTAPGMAHAKAKSVGRRPSNISTSVKADGDDTFTSMRRATEWSPEVEDLFRLQAAGWNHEEEYTKVYGPPERWPADVCPDQFINKLQSKSDGYFTYWRKWKECEENSLRKVKIFS